MSRDRVAVVHDYVTQRGGAERVVLAMVRALGKVPVYTSLYDRAATFDDFNSVEVRTSPLSRVGALRRHHRLAYPFLAGTFSSMAVDADVAVCSSSGWAHGAAVTGRKLVYCHAPARWLYQTDRYLGASTRGGGLAARGRQRAFRAVVAASRGRLEAWDRSAAQTADRYLVNSRAVGATVRELYGIEAEVLAPPPALEPTGPVVDPGGVEPGFWLCVSRLLPYKNLDAVVAAVSARPSERLVVVGRGPDRGRLEAMAGPGVRFVGAASDSELRWYYENCRALVNVAFEDFGLTPLEAASFGRPSITLRFGGFLDTVVEGRTGLYVEEPTASAVGEALEAAASTCFSSEELRNHAGAFSEVRFGERLRAVVDELA